MGAPISTSFELTSYDRHRYSAKIFRPVLVPYAVTIGDDVMLTDENCRQHCGRRAASHLPPPKTFQELEKTILEEWERIS
ncbi:hypothetical protein TNCV_4510041 [Trichonephila clavipes]|nr:hypothetical protein TNCV_4510041 [Trichonephila clavipes]